MVRLRDRRGYALILLAMLLFAAAATALILGAATPANEAARHRATERALGEAREALLAYAADRAISSVVGPGYLPCPDLDDDGWAEPTCGSQSGDSGQEQRLGRLPWKTLGLADLRDGADERLWYAVSSKHKGLLNCGVSAACVDMSPDAALGTITVRDASGAVLHDGTIAEPYRAAQGGAVAVVIAPGAPIERLGEGIAATMQSRDCAADCDARGRCMTDPPQRAATCDPANYLDRAPGARFASEDNAAFTDRNDAAGRALNRDGFIAGPVRLADGRLAVNDRVAAIGYGEWMPRVMRRVALEVAQCLRMHAAQHAAYPWPSPACAQAAGGASSWTGIEGARFGRVADAAWNGACNLSTAPAHSWWKAWRTNVFYALAPAFAPGAPSPPACGGDGACIEMLDAGGRVLAHDRHAAVLVAGPPLVRDGFLQHHDAASLGDVRQYLEDGNALLEGGAGCAGSPPAFACEAAGSCGRVTASVATHSFNDVAVAIP